MNMTYFTEQDFEVVYNESHHLYEMTSLDLFTEFVKVKKGLFKDLSTKTGAIDLSNTVKRFLSTGKQTFETDKRAIETDITTYINHMANMCNNTFTVQDLKTYLISFLTQVNKQNRDAGVSYDSLKCVVIKQMSSLPIDFTQGIRFETIKHNGIEKSVPRKTKLSYITSLDLFITTILSEKHANLHLEDLTESELAKLKQDFQTCLMCMKKYAEIESKNF